MSSQDTSAKPGVVYRLLLGLAVVASMAGGSAASAIA